MVEPGADVPPKAESSAEVLSPKWILALGLSLAAAVQATSFADAWYLDADDWFLIEMGREVVAQPSVDAFTRFWSAEPTWRPILTARAALETWLFGSAIIPRLIVTLSLHALSGVLLFLILSAWLGRPRAAAWAAVLFSVHPLHGETLVWFHSGFEGVTVTVPILLTLWAVATRRPLWIGLILFQVALLTRENALCVPLIIAAAAAARAPRESRWDRVVVDSAPYWALLVANIGLRVAWVSGYTSGEAMGSFHLAENPFAAVLTTIGHPWLPIHPGLENRTVWWLVFAAIPLALAWIQRTRSRWELKVAMGAFFLASIPFLPQFHDAERFVHAWPGGYEQRWYYFHLPLAFLMIWPAYLIMNRESRRGWSSVAICALAALFLLAQTFNARWWNGRAAYAQSVASVISGSLQKRPSGIGIVVREGRDSAELADQILLNLHIIWPKSGQQQVAAYHLRTEEGETRLERSMPNRLGQPEWRRVHTMLPYVTWWVFDAEKITMTPIAPRDLELPTNTVLPACCGTRKPTDL